MELTFSEEQEDLRRSVRRFLEEKSPETEVRRLMATTEGYDSAVWKQMADQLGLQGLTVPEEYGGSGYGSKELAVVLEEMGRSVMCAPYFSTVALAANLLLASGDDSAKKAHLPGIAAGTTIATVALTEASGRWDADGVTLRAEGSGGSRRLSGEKLFVLDGHVADLILVVGRSAEGISVFAVERGAEGLAAEAMLTMDETRKQSRLVFESTPATLVGVAGGGWDMVEAMLDRAAVALAAEQAGGAQKMLEMATDYAKHRIQFGRPIGSFQSIKHKLATMLLEVETAKAAAYAAAAAVAEGGEDLPPTANMAKTFCSEAYSYVAAESIQVHGGIGFTWDHPCHLYYKRARSSEVMLGSPAFHRELLAQRMGV